MEGIQPIADQLIASLLLALRIGPILAFAPPFSLIRAPIVFRVLLALGLATLMVAGNPTITDSVGLTVGWGGLVAMSAMELMLGITLMLVFQLAFAALYLAGRTLDIQAGFGLALLIDPTSRSQTPLIGTILVYAAAMLFFAMNGHHDLLRVVAASLDVAPIGFWRLPESPAILLQFISMIFVVGMGVTGAAMLCLFLTDIGIALITRTLPQFNALILGLQVKVIVILIILPLGFGLTAALLARMMAIMLEYLPRVV